jgi:hypothetical protein
MPGVYETFILLFSIGKRVLHYTQPLLVSTHSSTNALYNVECVH